ncbi:MAG: hypothetical protein ABH878_09970, partial [bacterium]
CVEKDLQNVFKRILGEFGYHEENKTLIIAEAVEPKEQTIREDILAKIRFCKFIVADITGKGIGKGERFNPNCVYELGYAHALNKKIIATVCREMSHDKKHKKPIYVPFDFSGVKFSYWNRNPTEESQKQFEDELKSRIKDIHMDFQREYWPPSNP